MLPIASERYIILQSLWGGADVSGGRMPGGEEGFCFTPTVSG